jgi:hypothetical protein
MTFSAYINWIIDNAANFRVYLYKIPSENETLEEASDRFVIYYVDPDTGRTVHVLSFSVIGEDIIDNITGLKIADKSKIHDLDTLKCLVLKDI